MKLISLFVACLWLGAVSPAQIPLEVEHSGLDGVAVALTATTADSYDVTITCPDVATLTSVQAVVEDHEAGYFLLRVSDERYHGPQLTFQVRDEG